MSSSPATRVFRSLVPAIAFVVFTASTAEAGWRVPKHYEDICPPIISWMISVLGDVLSIPKG